MKLKRRYELLIDGLTPKLVDVSDHGAGEGFDDSDDLKIAAIEAIAVLDHPMQREMVRSKVFALIQRAERERLAPADVLDSSHRQYLNEDHKSLFTE